VIIYIGIGAKAIGTTKKKTHNFSYTYCAHLMNFREQVSLKLHKYIRLKVEIIVN